MAKFLAEHDGGATYELGGETRTFSRLEHEAIQHSADPNKAAKLAFEQGYGPVAWTSPEDRELKPDGEHQAPQGHPSPSVQFPNSAPTGDPDSVSVRTEPETKASKKVRKDSEHEYEYSPPKDDEPSTTDDADKAPNEKTDDSTKSESEQPSGPASAEVEID